MRNRFFQVWGVLGSEATTSNLWLARAVSEAVAEQDSKRASSGDQEAAPADGPRQQGCPANACPD